MFLDDLGQASKTQLTMQRCDVLLYADESCVSRRGPKHPERRYKLAIGIHGLTNVHTIPWRKGAGLLFCLIMQTTVIHASRADYASSILIPVHSEWKFNTRNLQMDPTVWTSKEFDDSRWSSGQSGFGYADDDDRTQLSDMRGNYRGVRIRRHFDFQNLDAGTVLHLYVRYDDGFIAYINGHKVASAGVSTDGDQFTVEDHEADEFEHFQITAADNFVDEGNNVLALVGLNRSLDSSDFSLDPVLATEELQAPGIAVQLSRQQFLGDIEALERRFEDQSSYLTLTHFNYQKAFDQLRAKADEQVDTGDFAQELKRVIAQLGDAHAGVLTEFGGEMQRYLPFVLADTDTGVIAIDDSNNVLLDERRPYIAALDNIALDQWLSTADEYVSQASVQLRRRRGLRELRSITLLRKEMGLPESDEISLTLQTADGHDQKTYYLPLSAERLRSGKVPLESTHLMDDSIGYLRIASMSNSRIKEITQALEGFRNTDGLIIDVRDNSGGRYGLLEAIYGYFLPKGAKPYVSNIAAYRLSTGFEDDHLHYRPTFRQSYDGWSADEREAIRSALTQFKPQWSFPPQQFSDWHFMVLGKQPQNVDFYYSRPVVVLCNAGSFSATDGFLSTFADLPQVTIVGSPSAGGSGATKQFELPNSGLKIALSSMVSYRPDGRLYDGNGIEVDVHMPPVISDYLGATDTALSEAVSLIRSRR